MTTKLIQKHLFKGTQEFEIVDDQIKVRIKAPFKPEEILSVFLSVLNPEPVIERDYLHFNSRVNGEPLLSLYLAKPDAERFNAFVAMLKQAASQEYNVFAGISPAPQAGGMATNVYEAPPEFEDSDSLPLPDSLPSINLEEIDSAIMMLERYLDAEPIIPLVAALKALKAEPQNRASLIQLGTAFNESGPIQGAILTYAPYVSILLTDNPYSDR